MLQWQVAGATSVSLSPASPQAGATSVAVLPATTTSYVLTATNCAGTTTADVTVTVAAPALYQPAQQFQQATPIEGLSVSTRYGVGTNSYTRTTPLLIRYPQGATGRLPLIVWSHGGAMTEHGHTGYEEWGSALARAGYIVVHVGHVPPTPAEAPLLYREFGLTPPTDTVLTDLLEFAANIHRPRDMIAVLNALAGLAGSNAQLAGRIDFDRVALAGHSRGAYTVRTTACARINIAPTIQRYSFRDTTKATNTPLRQPIKAVLAMSPQGPEKFSFYDNGGGDHSWSSCVLPDMTQTSSGDFHDSTPADRVLPFTLMPPGSKHRMFISDTLATHAALGLGNGSVPQFDPWIISSGVAFLDAYVKGSAAARAYLESPNLERMSNGKATLSTR